MNTFYVAGQNESKWIEINAKNLRGAKVIASRMYQKCTGGRFDIAEKMTYANGEGEYVVVAYWSGESWSWVDAK